MNIKRAAPAAGLLAIAAAFCVAGQMDYEFQIQQEPRAIYYPITCRAPEADEFRLVLQYRNDAGDIESYCHVGPIPEPEESIAPELLQPFSSTGIQS